MQLSDLSNGSLKVIAACLLWKVQYGYLSESAVVCLSQREVGADYGAIVKALGLRPEDGDGDGERT